MEEKAFNVNENITSVASYDITVVQQLRYGDTTVTVLILLILLIRSLTGFVKAIKS